MSHSSALKGIRFTLDGRRLLTYCDDESVRVWDLTQLPSKMLWQSGSFVPDISPDGKRVAVPHLERIGRICDGETGEPLTPNRMRIVDQQRYGHEQQRSLQPR